MGGPVSTPALEKLAAGGLRYNRFHVNALCSPTRVPPWLVFSGERARTPIGQHK